MLCFEKHVYFTWYTLYIYVIYRKGHFLNEILFFTNFHWFKKYWQFYESFSCTTPYFWEIIFIKLYIANTGGYLHICISWNGLHFVDFFLSKSICHDGIMKFAYSCNFRLAHNYVLPTEKYENCTRY